MRPLPIVLVSALALNLTACQDDCPACGSPRPLAFSIDLSNAAQLALLEKNRSQSVATTAAGVVLVSSSSHAQEVEGEANEESGNLLKIDPAGNVGEVLIDALPEGAEGLTWEQVEAMGPPPARPRVVAVGFAPTGEVYVLFEHSFLYRTVESQDDGLEFWSSSSPYTCQLFRADLNLEEALVDESVKPLSPTNLRCITTAHEIPTWRMGKVMQFDASGVLYFPAHIGGTSDDLIYAYDPRTETLTEKVNANICWADVEVTPSGGIFYTGTTKVDGDCSGTAFFRYVSPTNELMELSRGWWDFAFDSEANPERPNDERIIFYGPDPDTSTGLPSWETACVYRYDPTIADPTARATRLTHCVRDIWGWLEGRDLLGWNTNFPDLDTRLERHARCTSEGQVFIGGAGIKQIEQTPDGTIILAGELQRKIGGEFTCTVEITAAHCSSLDPTHDYSACLAAGYQWVDQGVCDAPDWYGSAADCASGGGTWISTPVWYDNVKTSACLSTSEGPITTEDAAQGVVQGAGWRVVWTQCRTPDASNGNWTSTIQGVAALPAGSDASTLPVLLSSADEHAISFWSVDRAGHTMLYYSSFQTGRYVFSEVDMHDLGLAADTRRVLLEEYEVYNLAPSPHDPARLTFDALYFPTNSYRFGSINVDLDPDAIEDSFEVTDGFTGRLKSLIIVPQF